MDFLAAKLQLRCSTNSNLAVAGAFASFRLGVQSLLNSSPNLNTRPSGYFISHPKWLFSSGMNVNVGFVAFAVKALVFFVSCEGCRSRDGARERAVAT